MESKKEKTDSENSSIGKSFQAVIYRLYKRKLSAPISGMGNLYQSSLHRSQIEQ